MLCHWIGPLSGRSSPEICGFLTHGKYGSFRCQFAQQNQSNENTFSPVVYYDFQYVLVIIIIVIFDNDAMIYFWNENLWLWNGCGMKFQRKSKCMAVKKQQVYIRLSLCIWHMPAPSKKHKDIWGFPKLGVPWNGWFIRGKSIKMDDLGVTPVSGNLHVLIWEV